MVSFEQEPVVIFQNIVIEKRFLWKLRDLRHNCQINSKFGDCSLQLFKEVTKKWFENDLCI